MPDTGLSGAIDVLASARRNLGAESMIVFWNTNSGEVAVVVDDDGFQVFAGGEPVDVRP